MNWVTEPNSLRDQYNSLTLLINVRFLQTCHVCGTGVPDYGHKVGIEILPLCERCKQELYPVLSELVNVELTLLEFSALFAPVFDRKPRTIYLKLSYAVADEHLKTVRKMGPLGRLARHISVCCAYKFLCRDWTPVLPISEGNCE